MTARTILAALAVVAVAGATSACGTKTVNGGGSGTSSGGGSGQTSGASAAASSGSSSGTSSGSNTTGSSASGAAGASCDAGLSSAASAPLGAPCVSYQEGYSSFGGFPLTEVSVESKTFACASRICLVDHFQGRITCPYGQDSNGNGPDGSPGCQTPGTCAPVRPDLPGTGQTVAPQCSNRQSADAVYCSCRCANGNGGRGPIASRLTRSTTLARVARSATRPRPRVRERPVAIVGGGPRHEVPLMLEHTPPSENRHPPSEEVAPSTLK